MPACAHPTHPLPVHTHHILLWSLRGSSAAQGTAPTSSMASWRSTLFMPASFTCLRANTLLSAARVHVTVPQSVCSPETLVRAAARKPSWLTFPHQLVHHAKGAFGYLPVYREVLLQPETGRLLAGRTGTWAAPAATDLGPCTHQLPSCPIGSLHSLLRHLAARVHADGFRGQKELRASPEGRLAGAAVSTVCTAPLLGRKTSRYVPMYITGSIAHTSR